VSGDAISPRGGAQVVVPEILMSPNLISSRAPTRTVRAQGRVVMQATVNRHGEVTHVHVIDGDPALHQAAVDAALSRRYKPYLLNGTPVDVATTISIDFPGNR
jgi:protein TonB